MDRPTLDILNEVLEYLDDLERDPDTSEYFVDRGADLTEKIEAILGKEEFGGDDS